MWTEESELALILSLLEVAKGRNILSDERYSGRKLEDIVGETFKQFDTLKRICIAHVDVGSRIVESPGTSTVIMKLSTYELKVNKYQKIKSSVLQPFYGQQNDLKTNLLLLPGNYRVRQATMFMLEVAATLNWANKLIHEECDEVIVLKDGPLLQQISQYFSQAYLLSKETVRAVLSYSGLDMNTILSIIDESERLGSIYGRRDLISPGLVILEIMERLYELTSRTANLHIVGVVENTSRSRSLLLALTIALFHEALNRTRKSKCLPTLMAHSIEGILLDALSEDDINRVSDCLGFYPNKGMQEIVSLLTSSLRPQIDSILEELNRKLERRKLSLCDLLSKVTDNLAWTQNPEERSALQFLSHIIVSSGLLQLASRDPDIVMLAYYLGILDSIVTSPLPRLELVASMVDAVETLESLAKKSKSKMEDKALEIGRRLFDLSWKITSRYLIVEPPPTCQALKETISSNGLDPSTVKPYLIAESDAYQYAPPLRIEYFSLEQPKQSAATFPDLLTAIVLLESAPAQYKYPIGLLIADRTSRVTVEEALSAQPLENRLIPLRYYIRKWEKRLELS